MRYLIIFFIAMLPLAELRIAIPTGLFHTNTDYFLADALVDY